MKQHFFVSFLKFWLLNRIRIFGGRKSCPSVWGAETLQCFISPWPPSLSLICLLNIKLNSKLTIFARLQTVIWLLLSPGVPSLAPPDLAVLPCELCFRVEDLPCLPLYVVWSWSIIIVSSTTQTQIFDCPTYTHMAWGDIPTEQSTKLFEQVSHVLFTFKILASKNLKL